MLVASWADQCNKKVPEVVNPEHHLQLGRYTLVASLSVAIGKFLPYPPKAVFCGLNQLRHKTCWDGESMLALRNFHFVPTGIPRIHTMTPMSQSMQPS